MARFLELLMIKQDSENASKLDAMLLLYEVEVFIQRSGAAGRVESG